MTGKQRSAAIFSVIFLVIISCFTSTVVSQIPTELNWMTGTWTQHIAGIPSGREEWKIINDSTWEGAGYAYREKDTVRTELLFLRSRNGKLWYVADVPENKKEVAFEITRYDSTGFTASNTEHDFPKRIEYSYVFNEMRVVVAGEKRSFNIAFRR